MDIMEKLINNGLVSLTPKEKTDYLLSLCASVGLDPITQPFQIISFKGRETVYAGRGCAAQLNRLHGISHSITSTEKIGDVYVVCNRATDKDGRFTDEIGAVSICGVSGNDLANAIMAARTKAMRRATLTHVGLGMLDEEELSTMPEMVPVKLAPPEPVKTIKPQPKSEPKPQSNIVITHVEPGQATESELTKPKESPVPTAIDGEVGELLHLMQVYKVPEDSVWAYATSKCANKQSADGSKNWTTLTAPFVSAILERLKDPARRGAFVSSLLKHHPSTEAK